MIRRAAVALVVAGLMFGCGDRAGSTRGVTAEKALRLISLAPHLTELIFSAGAGEYLVGAVAYSDYPVAARSVPRIGDAFAVDLERLTALAPTHVLAWAGGNPETLLQQLEGRGFNVVRFETPTLDAAADHVRRLGALAGTSTVADASAAQYGAALDELRQRYAEAPIVSAFVQVASQPLYTISDRHTIAQMLRVCGGRNVFANVTGLAAIVSAEAVVAADPQVMISTESMASMALWRRFNGRAVQSDQLHVVEADVVTRASLRMIDGTRQICSALDKARAVPSVAGQ